MSLLMDALKRAEEAKRQNAPAGDSGGLALEPTDDRRSPLPDLSSHIDSVDADLQAEADGNATSAGQAAGNPRSAQEHILRIEAEQAVQRDSNSLANQAQRDSARQVFAAKLREDDGRAQRNNIIRLIAIGSLAGLALAGYFGYQFMALNDSANRLVPTAQLNAPIRPITAPLQTAAITAPRPTESPAPPAVVVDEAPTESTATALAAATPDTDRDASQRQSTTARSALPRAERQPARTPQPAIRIERGTSPLEQALATGYAALQAGDYDTAGVAYAAALQADPKHPDALLGLAAVANRQGNPDRAAAHYLRVLESDPRNAAAHVGLLGLGASGDANQRESRLRSLLAAQAPHSSEAGMLNFGLGNLYASQRRWNEAQQAFFAAHVSDAGNPDYLFNLAVSLDHLQQPALALKNYQAAKAAVANRQGSFDIAQVDARIRQLDTSDRNGPR